MAFSVAHSSASTSSPPMTMNDPTQGVSNSITNQYPVQYVPPGKPASVTQTQSVPQPAFGAQNVLITARDWQHSVASVYDPQGLKRRWNYSTDVSSENASKRPR